MMRILLVLALWAVSFVCFSQSNSGEVDKNSEAEVFRVVEEMPQFPGGEKALYKFLAKNINYPDEAKEKGLSGKVFVSFIVETNGEISNVNVERGASPCLNEEALRIVKMMPKWKPGIQKGKLVRVQYHLPINFSLT